MTASLFVRLGGEPALIRILDLHYGRVLADDYLGEYFMDTNIDRLKAMQLAFLRKAFGDPGASYHGATMHAAHNGQMVTEQAFDLFIDGFVTAAAESGADADTQAEVRTALKAMRASILVEFKPNPAFNYPAGPR
jgi:hemoglobin